MGKGEFHLRPDPCNNADHDHEPTLVILNSHVAGIVTVLFPGPAIADRVKPGHLKQLLDVKVAMKNGVVQGQIKGLVFGEHLLDLQIEVLPLIGAVKVVYNQKASTQQVFPEAVRLCLGEVEVTDLNGVEKGMFE